MSQPDTSSSRPAVGQPSLLFVDDEKRVLASMHAMFRRHYQVFIADSGAKALEILDREAIDLVISDQRMPGMTGVELLCEIKTRAPTVMRILLTGYADLDAIEASINDGEVFRYLMKPCPPDDLKKAITMAVDAARNSNPVREEIELPRTTPVRRKPAQLIPFPPGRRVSSPAQAAAAPTGRKSGIKTAASRTAERASPIEVLVLSADKALYSVIEQVTEGYPVLRAATVDQALKLLAENRIGVMVTDTTANAADVENLTKTLKQEVPELITIVASDRSDAHSLISLINEGQIYRFLLKPVSRGQSRLWVSSAIRKFAELSQNSQAADRYQVVATAEPAATGLLAALKVGFETLRSRLNRT